MDKQGRRWKRKRQDSACQKTHQFPKESVDQLQPTFDKVFSYDVQGGVIHDSDLFPDTPMWQDAELQTMKGHLNAIKSQLNQYEISEWHQHTSDMNPAGLIIATVKQGINPELCTQAWCKFHEILNKFPVMKTSEKGTLRSLHLCEAPGAFVTSLNHYLQSRDTDVREWVWTANTLNPHYEQNSQDTMIADDRFIQHTMPNWNFGSDNTGNIMSAANIRELIQGHNGSGFELVTADGSIDCSDNPSDQENITARLHFCELVTALNCLKPGGSLVIKMFTLYEESSISMLYLMICAFQNVHVFKPASSKPGNSEVYVVCVGFKSLTREANEKLLTKVNGQPLEKCILSEKAIPEAFIAQHRQCCMKFYNFQTVTIKKNRECYVTGLSEKQRHDLKLQRQCCAALYLEKCQLTQIAHRQRIATQHVVGHAYRHPGAEPNYACRRRQGGSYVERQHLNHLPRIDKLRSVHTFDTGQGFYLGAIAIEHWRYEGKREVITGSGDYVTGARIEWAKSSRFCSQELLTLYNDFLLESENIRSTPIVSPVAKVEEFAQEISDSLLESLSVCQFDSSETSLEFGVHSAHQMTNLNSMDVIFCGLFGRVAQVLQGTSATQQRKLNMRFVGQGQVRSGNGQPTLYVIDSRYESNEQDKSCENSNSACAETTDSVALEMQCLLDKDTQIRALKELQRLVYGDHVILCMPAPVTRYSASVLFVLSSVFTSVRFFSSPVLGSVQVYLHCSSFLKSQYTKFSTVITDVIAYFETNSQSLEQSVADSDVISVDLLQFIPIKLLYSSTFYAGISTVNDSLLKRRINRFICSLKSSDTS